jgi:DNA-binding response OmpR family regulator
MADPDESLHPVYREPLSREGFEMDQALTGLECVSRLRERVPDILIIEPQLPWGGGDGVLALMSEDSTLAAIPVLILTSCRDPRVLSRVTRFPINDYQLKPIASDRLAGRIRTLLNRPKRHFTLGEQTGRLEGAIAKRTGGRVWDLRVENIDGRVIVHGRSDSHHVKQLALAAVLEAFEASQSQSERVELDIDVVADDYWLSRQDYALGTRYDNFSNEFDLKKES